jgi:hypothetical protein
VRFVDEQEKGPYRVWRHTHTFEPRDGGTLLGDHVVFAVPGGPLAPLLRRWWVEPDVLRIFRFRLERMAARFGGSAVASGSSRARADGASAPDAIAVRPRRASTPRAARQRPAAAAASGAGGCRQQDPVAGRDSDCRPVVSRIAISRSQGGNRRVPMLWGKARQS